MQANLVKKTRYFETTWFMWITLIIFPPLGLILLWRQGRYSKKKRITISIMALVYFVLPIIIITTAKLPLFNDHSELVSAFNIAKKELNASNEITSITKDGNVQTFKIDKDITLIENLDEIDRIHELIMIGQGEGIDITTSLALLIGMTNTELSNIEIGNVLKELRFFDKDFKYDKNETEVEINTIRYNLKYDQTQGVIFSISKVN
ncbi:hypothetical protein LAV73_08835 [Lysinibacillus xylanilyticus]|uniref:hypothetical protein n=1 Tax=Lysinibacillus xylanilyticus TaxID=582475 RepID=UPI002B253B43|nr:hypothetical protein [Lysinibacillus xylanilyticus]MEB2280100.1 hypothetical protein [Lysinibacillus xylanilyticus]